MTVACSGSSVVLGLLFAITGLFAFVVGVASWIAPDSDFVQAVVVDAYPPSERAGPVARFFGRTRERAGFSAFVEARLYGPLFGALFFAAGCFIAAGSFACPSLGALATSMFAPLELRFTPVVPFFAAVAGLLGAIESFRFSTPKLVLNAVVAAGWGFAAGEAASFGGGPQTERWISVEFVLLFAFGGLLIVWRLLARRHG